MAAGRAGVCVLGGEGRWIVGQVDSWTVGSPAPSPTRLCIAFNLTFRETIGRVSCSRRLSGLRSTVQSPLTLLEHGAGTVHLLIWGLLPPAFSHCGHFPHAFHIPTLPQVFIQMYQDHPQFKVLLLCMDEEQQQQQPVMPPTSEPSSPQPLPPRITPEGRQQQQPQQQQQQGIWVASAASSGSSAAGGPGGGSGGGPVPLDSEVTWERLPWSPGGSPVRHEVAPPWQQQLPLGGVQAGGEQQALAHERAVATITAYLSASSASASAAGGVGSSSGGDTAGEVLEHAAGDLISLLQVGDLLCCTLVLLMYTHVLLWVHVYVCSDAPQHGYCRCTHVLLAYMTAA